MLWSVTNSCKIHRNSIYHKICCHCPKFTTHGNLFKFWLLTWVSIARSAELLPKASLLLPAANVTDWETLYCACQSDLQMLLLRGTPRALPLILQWKPYHLLQDHRQPIEPCCQNHTADDHMLTTITCNHTTRNHVTGSHITCNHIACSALIWQVINWATLLALLLWPGNSIACNHMIGTGWQPTKPTYPAKYYHQVASTKLLATSANHWHITRNKSSHNATSPATTFSQLHGRHTLHATTLPATTLPSTIRTALLTVNWTFSIAST